MGVLGRRSEQQHPGEAGQDNDGNLDPGGRHQQHGRTGKGGDGDPRPIGAEGPAHPPDGLGHHRHGDQFEAVQQSRRQRVAPGADSQSEQHQKNCRGQGEAHPGGQCAGEAGPGKTDCHAGLAAGGTGEELA